jgi:amidase
MARTIPDLALLLSVLAGFDARAPLSLDGTGAPFRGPFAADFKGKRIGWLGDLTGWSPHEPGVLELCTTALKSFESLGCTVEPALPDSPPEAAWQAFMKLRQWQQGGNIRAYYANPAQRALLKPEAIWEVEQGLKLSAYDISAATAARTTWSNAIQRLFTRFDFLIMPTAQVFAFDAAEHWPKQIAGQTMQTYHEWMKAVCLISLAGCPSLAVPAGFSDKGAMGIQIIAPVQRDMDCFKLAYAYDRATRWTTRRLPALFTSAS